MEELVLRIKTVLAIALWISFVFSAQNSNGGQSNTVTLTLDEALSMSMQNNRDVLIAREEVKRAEQQVREARAGAYPSITLQTFYTRNLQKPAFFLSFDNEVQKIEIGTNNVIQSVLSVEQPLYSGGLTGAAIEIARTYTESFYETVDQTEKNVKLQVKQQFLSILLAKEIVKVNKRTLEQAQSHFDHVNTLYSNGAASEFDLLRAEVQHANVLPKALSSENDLVLRKDMLKNLLGLPLDQELEVIGTLTPQFVPETDLDKDETGVYGRRSDYKNLELTRDIYEKRIRIERAQWFPELSLNYSFQFQGQSNNFRFGSTQRVNSQSASLDLRIPIFDGFRTSARVQQARIDVKETDYRLLRLKELIDIQIRQARVRMDDAQKRNNALSKTIQQAQKAYDISQVRFSSGQGTQLELFDAQVALEMAQLNTLQSIFDYEVAKAQWENAVGR